MDVTKEHIRYIYHYQFTKDSDKKCFAMNMNAVYGNKAISVNYCRLLFQIFQDRNTGQKTSMVQVGRQMFMRTACRTSWKKYHCNRSGINRQSYVWICNLSSITVCHQKCQQSFSKSNHVPSKCVLVSISYDKNERFLDRIIIDY